jgi:hypothetical protein
MPDAGTRNIGYPAMNAFHLRRASRSIALVFVAAVAHASAGSQQQQLEAFHGVTTDGEIVPGLFPLRATGVSTEPMRTAANALIAVLTPEQRARTLFAAGDDEWRLWNNVHRYVRAGTSFQEMTAEQRARAYDMIRASLSARGFEKARNVMRLNGHLADVLDRPEEYGEFLYWLTIMGTPSATQPWGWQLDGHHLIVNYFVLGDQVVMTPTFMGSEPVIATGGRFAGTSVMQEEQDQGLAFMEMLDDTQRRRATLETQKPRNNALAQAFRDNLVLDYAGIRANELNPAQRDQLLRVVAEYVDNMSPGHARVRMAEVRDHLDDTWFAWIGAVGPDAAFYYRIQSPVILIEFDHQLPVALPGPRVPGREHVHSVVRTPNGNDYGRDLLRQHYERHGNDPAHGH